MDYEIIEWNEYNYDVSKNVFMREVYIKKNFVYVFDYVRLDIIYIYGGFYLDIDVEFLKSLDFLRIYECFLVREISCDVNIGLIIGVVKGYYFLKLNMFIYDKSDLIFFNKICVEVIINLLINRGFKNKNII